MRFIPLITTLLVLPFSPAMADGPGDNNADNVRRIPPLGVEVSAEDRAELEKGLNQLSAAMKEIKDDPLLPDVEIFHKAVRYALDYQEFQKPQELKLARQQIDLGLKRAADLSAGNAPWTRETGLVVRGFRSKIDGGVQPYGLVIPDNYDFDSAQKYRLDFWFHGRAEKVNEVSFIQQRLSQAGLYTPADTIMLHPWARYSNANKFAGEIDCLEALDHAKSQYRIDDDRILVRGFSMGGAACWQFAVHYADRWCAANPGAGFSETPDFLRTFQGETLTPTPFERKLWHLYDCVDYAANLYNLPTVAYSGELDRQKQAADMMEVALAKESIALRHIIGPKTEHKTHPDSAIEITNRLDAIAKVGRQFPDEIKFVTWTLRYNTMHWLTVDRMAEHWKQARVEAKVGQQGIEISKIANVSNFTLSFPPGHCSLELTQPVEVSIDGQSLTSESPVFSDRSWTASFALRDGKWIESKADDGLAKKHGLQGPIDDAFMDSFLFVTPGKKSDQPFDNWAQSEQDRAVTHWRQQFRGDARVKSDSDITDEDIAAHNLVLWGNSSSNAVLAKIADQLPIKWTADQIIVGNQKFDATKHGLILVYPNPLNPERYVVLNSGFTYREYDYLNNARQVPKLPDWAVIDLSEKPGPRRPGRVAAAGFFDESWKLK